MITLTRDPYCIQIYLPSEASNRIVYLHASGEEGAEVWHLLPEPRPVLAVISGTDWNRDFSPWPAPSVFSKGGDFSGGAGTYLVRLAEDLIPAVESALPGTPAVRCIAGYSLAGLFALWCTFRCDLFDAAAALSPSVWFDGFTGFMQSNPPSKRLKRVSLSLGDREKRTRNPRMAAAEDAIVFVREHLEACGVEVFFRSEHGGHFADVPGRIARGIAAL